MDKIGLVIFIVFGIFIVIRYLIIPNIILLYKTKCVDINNNNNNNNNNDTEENEDESYLKEGNSLLDDCLPPYTPVTILNTSSIQLFKKDMPPAPDYYSLLPPPITPTMESNENETVMNINDLPPPPSYEICVNNNSDINITVEPVSDINNNDRDINITIEPASDSNETNNRI